MGLCLGYVTARRSRGNQIMAEHDIAPADSDPRPRGWTAAIATVMALMALMAVVVGAYVALGQGGPSSPVIEAAAADNELAGAGDDAAGDADATSSTADSQVPSCPPGTVPLLDIEEFPDDSARGVDTPSDALRALEPSARNVEKYPMGTSSDAPVWFVADGETFIATVLPDGNWFVSAAIVEGCHDPRSDNLPRADGFVDGPVG